jgi:hypothetical protein
MPTSDAFAEVFHEISITKVITVPYQPVSVSLAVRRSPFRPKEFDELIESLRGIDGFAARL